MEGKSVGEVAYHVNSPKVSVIIPAYNEEESIEKVLYQIRQLFELLPSMEVIVVDDGSTDQTATKIEKFPFVKYIVHSRNRGKGAAVRTGFQVATGDIFVIQDADSEYSPFNIPTLLRPILTGKADVVYGSRFKGKQNSMSWSHYLGNKVLSLIARLFYRVPITDALTGHKCFIREAVESLELKENGFNIEVEITAQIFENGWRFAEVPITYSIRTSGSSKIGYIDGIYSMMKLIKEFKTFRGRV